MSRKSAYLACARGYSSGTVIGDVYPSFDEAMRAAKKIANRVTEDIECAGGHGGAQAYVQRVTIHGRSV